MKNGFKVFDADAHVVYPADLWDRFLDKRFRHRVGRRAPAGLDTYNPVTVDGRWTQHPTIALRPVPEGDQLDHRGHDRQVRRGDGGPGLHRRPGRQGAGGRGRRHHGHLRAGVRPVDRRHRPRAAGGDGARLQPLGPGDARDLRRARARVGPRAAAGRLAGRSRRSSTPTTTWASAASGRATTTSTTATSATATTTRSGSCCRTSTSRSAPTSSWG